VLLASVAALQVYYLSDYTSIYPALPLSVALATAWAAGHRRWSLLVAAWYVLGPLAYAVFQLSAPTQPPLPLLGEAVSNTAMFAAVLVLGEAVRSRRALDRAHRLLLAEQERSERLLLNVLPAPIAARLKQREEVIADRFSDVTVLFADLVDFTPRAERIAPEQVVQVLNELFSRYVTRWPDAPTPAGSRCRSASASTPARWWPASSVPAGSATTCGATPSTPPAAWSPTGSPAASR
jgi:hypothetical protein